MNTLEFQVEELNNSELQQIEGGIAPLIIYGGCILIGMAVGAAISYYASKE